MPFIIQHLIPETQNLVTITEDDSAQHALSLMIEHDFSQLPVMDATKKLKGMVTSDSILRVVSHLKVIPENLKVSHAITKANAYRMEDDLSELLKGLRDINAIPIVDKQNKVIAIVTNYDTAEYFRKRAEDIMLAEDIEATLKDFIESSHKGEDGDLDDDSLSAEIQAVTPSNKEYQNKFRNALSNYIGKTTGQDPKIDDEVFNTVFTKHLKQPVESRTFEELTLYEFIQIFKNLWPQHSSNFNLEWTSVNHLLDSVRQTRNAIAHFREVTPQQREQLKFCADFLDRHRPSVELASTSVYELPKTSLTPSEVAMEAIRKISERSEPPLEGNKVEENNSSLNREQSAFSPVGEELEPNESRYAPLAIWLQEQESDRVSRTFQEVGEIIQDELPPSAFNNRSWWANDSVGHTQSIQWLDAGWRVSSVNMSAEQVVFSRMGDRQSAYIDFFSQLQNRLTSIGSLSVYPLTNPQGRHWFTLSLSPKDSSDEKPPHIIFSFARKSRFRIEAYINEREKAQNDLIFDRLHNKKTNIESEFGAPLSWERLDDKRGSRIAYYRSESSITDDVEELIKVQNWAVDILPKFYSVLSGRFIAAQKEALEPQIRESS